MAAIAYGGGTLELASLGTHVVLHPACVFIQPEHLHLGHHVVVSEFAWIHAGKCTVVGSFVHLANHTSIAGGSVCILEDFVGLSAGARIVTGTDLVHGEGLTNPTIPPPFRAGVRSFVHLGRHVFVGTNAVVHPGITVGEGAVVGSGAVVTHDVDPWTIVAGVPARPIGTRESSTMKALEARLYDALGVPPLDPAPFLPLKRDDVRLPEVR
jgi:acetyltransferase-like isoleucine patch superfamily enzyme